MATRKYIDTMEELQEILLNFIESQDDSLETNQFIEFCEKHKDIKEQNYLRAILHLLSRVSENHFRGSGLIGKIEEIILYFEKEIKQIFSNLEIFNIFKNHGLILLFLIEKKLIAVDESIANLITSNCAQSPSKSQTNKQKFGSLDNLQDEEEEEKEPEYKNLPYFLFPEIKEFLKNKEIENKLLEKDPDIFSTFSEKRLIGENDSYICKLMREDSIDEFIPYYTRNTIRPSSLIKRSIFETNRFLLKNRPSLIEYAAFYGSMQIVQFLEKNGAELNPCLWFYVIHGKNPNLIHFLEENQVKPADNSYSSCYKESLKCHHNDIANYISDNLLNRNFLNLKLNENFKANIAAYCFRYYNYLCLPKDLDLNSKFVFLYACKYDHIKIVNEFIQNKNFNSNEKVSVIEKKIFQNFQ